MNDRPIPELALAVLCGGISQRMGTSKAQLDFAGEPLVARMLRRLGTVCGGDRFVVASPGQDLPSLDVNVAVVHDRQPGLGPLEGLIVATQTASKNALTSAMTMVGCDLPWLEPALIRAMFHELRQDQDAIVVRDQQRAHPLVAIYRPRVAGIAQARLSDGQRSLHGLVEALPAQTVDLDFVRKVDPQMRSLLNVNTPEDYERALRLLSE